jgi:hypothetical protein
VKPALYLGWDQSMNHAAGVAISDDAEMIDWWAISSTTGDQNPETREHLTLMPTAIRASKKSKKGIADPQVRGLARLVAMVAWMMDSVYRNSGDVPKYIAVEDYALRAAQGAHQIGEVGGALRVLLMHSSDPLTLHGLRLYNVTEVKMAACDNGTADKDTVVRPAVLGWAQQDFVDLFCRLEARGVSNDILGDIVDAYVLAHMVRAECHLRDGRMQLWNLSGGMKRVFNRVSDKTGGCYIERPFLTAANTWLST